MDDDPSLSPALPRAPLSGTPGRRDSGPSSPRAPSSPRSSPRSAQSSSQAGHTRRDSKPKEETSVPARRDSTKGHTSQASMSADDDPTSPKRLFNSLGKKMKGFNPLKNRKETVVKPSLQVQAERQEERKRRELDYQKQLEMVKKSDNFGA